MLSEMLQTVKMQKTKNGTILEPPFISLYFASKKSDCLFFFFF